MDGLEGHAMIDMLCSIAMNIELDQLAVARSIAEEWFASLSDQVMDHISASREQDPVTEGYNKVVELYVGRTLPRMHDFESANTFLDYNSVLTDTKKKVYFTCHNLVLHNLI